MEITLKYQPSFSLAVVQLAANGLTARGRVLMSTRSEEAFLGWLLPKIPKSSS